MELDSFMATHKFNNRHPYCNIRCLYYVVLIVERVLELFYTHV